MMLHSVKLILQLNTINECPFSFAQRWACLNWRICLTSRQTAIVSKIAKNFWPNFATSWSNTVKISLIYISDSKNMTLHIGKANCAAEVSHQPQWTKCGRRLSMNKCDIWSWSKQWRTQCMGKWESLVSLTSFNITICRIYRPSSAIQWHGEQSPFSTTFVGRTHSWSAWQRIGLKFGRIGTIEECKSNRFLNLLFFVYFFYSIVLSCIKLSIMISFFR